jgi:thiol-disulfide isomerase/thioredoxin
VNILGTIVCHHILATLSFCQPLYSVKGVIKGLGNRPVTVSYWQNNSYKTDTIQVQQGRFSLAMRSSDGNLATLAISPSTKLTFWLEKPVVLITGSVESTPVLKCTGTTENNLMETYRQTIERPFSILKQGKSSTESDSLILEEYRQTRQFIKQHPASLTAAYLLYWQTIYDTTIFNELEAIWADLAPAIRNSYWARKATNRIYNVRNKPRIGKKLPNFILDTSTGGRLSLDSLKGKYILLDFWGTWCKPCIQGIPELKALHEKYKNRLTIISIAIEDPENRDKWLRMTSHYDMSWLQVIDTGGWKDGVDALYDIIEYPTMLLADPQGIYIKKLKSGEQLEAVVGQFLNK